ncbi:MAG: hypothetical protein Q4F11_05715, partial [Eubacteriales bacterium]|nr:hypothetical protein [Eubacteriales bacterium]
MQAKKKKYPFIIMIIVSVLVFWSGKLTLYARQLMVKQEQVTDSGIAYVEQETTCEGLEETTVYDDLEYESTSIEETTSGKREFYSAGMEYLDGALFIGDSRTSTLYEYAGWDKTAFFVEYGLTIWNVMDAPIATIDSSGNKITLREALKKRQYEKIYIMLG